LIYKHTKLVKRVVSSRVRTHQRKFLLAIYALRKVKMDQRKLMDNANTITDMAKTQNSVYEIVSDVNNRQDVMEERLSSIEDKITSIQLSLDLLPDTLNRVLLHYQNRQSNEKDNEQEQTIRFGLISSSRSCPQNPWGQQCLNGSHINAYTNGINIHNKKVSNQVSIDSSTGLGVPSVIPSQSRTPPPYTEKTRTNINHKHQRRPSISDEEKTLSFNDNIGRISLFQPVSTTPPIFQNSSHS